MHNCFTPNQIDWIVLKMKQIWINFSLSAFADQSISSWFRLQSVSFENTCISDCIEGSQSNLLYNYTQISQ
jgi:hypothetical protein